MREQLEQEDLKHQISARKLQLPLSQHQSQQQPQQQQQHPLQQVSQQPNSPPFNFNNNHVRPMVSSLQPHQMIQMQQQYLLQHQSNCVQPQSPIPNTHPISDVSTSTVPQSPLPLSPSADATKSDQIMASETQSTLDLSTFSKMCYELDVNSNTVSIGKEYTSVPTVPSTLPSDWTFMVPSSSDAAQQQQPTSLYQSQASTFIETPPSSIPKSPGISALDSSLKESLLASSCPPDPTEAMIWTKQRQKKENHNKIERRRRYNINDRIQELGMLLSREAGKYSNVIPPNLKYTKGTILKSSVDFMKETQREVKYLEQKNFEWRNRMAESHREIEHLKQSLEEKEYQLHELRNALMTAQQLLQENQIKSPVGSMISENSSNIDFNSMIDELSSNLNN